jgi:hypothetical protein
VCGGACAAGSIWRATWPGMRLHFFNAAQRTRGVQQQFLSSNETMTERPIFLSGFWVKLHTRVINKAMRDVSKGVR